MYLCTVCSPLGGEVGTFSTERRVQNILFPVLTDFAKSSPNNIKFADGTSVRKERLCLLLVESVLAPYS